MRTRIRVALLCGLFLALADATRPQTERAAIAQESAVTVTVDVASGRSFAGEVDSRTDEAQLWLRCPLGSGILRRPIDWDRVVEVRLAGESFSSEEFQQAVRSVSQMLGEQAEPEEGASKIVIGPSKGRPDRQLAPAATAAAAHKPRRVESLAIDVRVGEWDGDVDVDGLLLEIYPLDASGEVVPVNGAIEAILRCERTGVVKLRRPFNRLGRWTKRVRATDFGPRGASYRLPFQAVHPEFDLKWASYGAVHVRLSVPGQGVFERTESTVRIRPYSAVRDQLEQATGRRFFQGERTSGGR